MAPRPPPPVEQVKVATKGKSFAELMKMAKKTSKSALLNEISPRDSSHVSTLTENADDGGQILSGTLHNDFRPTKEDVDRRKRSRSPEKFDVSDRAIDPKRREYLPNSSFLENDVDNSGGEASQNQDDDSEAVISPTMECEISKAIIAAVQPDNIM